MRHGITENFNTAKLVKELEVITLIKFNGREYPTKLLNIPGFGEKLVSIEGLEKTLFDAEGFYVSDEARVIDEKIFFYVPDNIINSNEKSLVELIEEVVN